MNWAWIHNSFNTTRCCPLALRMSRLYCLMAIEQALSIA
jgi:hypothetical protein